MKEVIREGIREVSQNKGDEGRNEGSKDKEELGKE